MAGLIGGGIIGLLTAGLLIMFIVYRMRKKDEGSYALEETKKPLNAYDYRHCPTKEFYA
jgi:syndecan 2